MDLLIAAPAFNTAHAQDALVQLDLAQGAQ
jgi:hypothetical protein